MKYCECAEPKGVAYPNGRREESCSRCAKLLNPRWTSNDETVAEFFDRLAECFPTEPPWFEDFRACMRGS